MAAAIAALIVVTTAAVKPLHFAPGVSFRISTSTKIFPGDTPRAQDDEVVRGRGVAVNGRARIEFLAFTPAPAGITTDDFLIAADSGHSFILHSNNQRYTPSDDMFGGPAVIALGRITGGRGGGPGRGDGADAGGAGGAGGAGRAAGGGRGGRPGGGGPPGGRGDAGAGGARGARGRGRGGIGSGFLSQLDLMDVSFKIEKLGAGEVLDGRQTQRYRITTDYRILWVDQSLPAHAVTEIWTAQLPAPIPNPFEPLIVADQSADGPLIEYALKLRAVRAQLEGTPVKVVSTTTLTGVREIAGLQSFLGADPTMDKLTIVQQTEIRNVQPADVDPKLVTVSAPGERDR